MLTICIFRSLGIFLTYPEQPSYWPSIEIAKATIERITDSRTSSETASSGNMLECVASFYRRKMH